MALELQQKRRFCKVSPRPDTSSGPPVELSDLGYPSRTETTEETPFRNRALAETLAEIKSQGYFSTGPRPDGEYELQSWLDQLDAWTEGQIEATRRLVDLVQECREKQLSLRKYHWSRQ